MRAGLGRSLSIAACGRLSGRAPRARMRPASVSCSHGAAQDRSHGEDQHDGPAERDYQRACSVEAGRERAIDDHPSGSIAGQQRGSRARAADQAGYFTAAQAKALGYSYPAQAHHVVAANWTRVDRGIFRLTDWIPEIHDDLARWNLWSKERAVVSHDTALGVHGVGEFESPRIHITVPRGFRMRDDALLLHTADLPAEEIETGPGFRLTTLTRSLIDVAATHADEDQLARALGEGLARGTVTRRQLRARAEAIDPMAALRIERALGLLGPA